MDRNIRLRDLETRLTNAQQRVRKASLDFAEATDYVPSGIPYPDSVTRIHIAAREYRSAMIEYESASRELTNFLIEGPPAGSQPS